MFVAPLPFGVTRDRHCCVNVTLHTCHALAFTYVDLDGQEASLIAWRHLPANIQPIEVSKRLRDLRPGDKVLVFGRPAKLAIVSVYR